MPELLYKELSYAVIGAAMEVHRILGPGFLEAVYQAALARELTLRGIRFEQYLKLPVSYKGEPIGDYQADFVIENKMILEIKAVSTLHPKHEAQAIHYLTATGLKLAILLNFGAPSLDYQRIVK
jgi:GxxExxY protein